MAEETKRDKETKLAKETKPDKFRRYFIGPFQFLAISLITSEYLLGTWMSTPETSPTEKIVAGSLSVAVLIAVLVIFCIVYSIKKKHGDCEKH